MSNYTIFDLDECVETVELRGKSLAVFGVNLDALHLIVEKFPEVKTVIANQKVSELDAEKLTKLMPQAIAYVCAVGLTNPGAHDTSDSWRNEIDKVHKKTRSLALGEQIAILTKVISVTMPQGKDPFFAQLRTVTGVFSGGSAQPVGSSPEQPSLTFVTADGGKTSKRLHRVG